MNLLPWVPGAVREYLQGVQDALNPYWTVAFVARSATIRKATVRCVALNGVLFLGSIFLLHRGLLPLIHFFGHSVLHLADRGSGTDRVESLGPIGRFVDAVVFLFYQMFWIVPLYCISLLMNTIWYGKISNAAYELRHRTKADLGIAVAIKENIYRALLVFFFIAETSAAYLFVPLAGPAVSLVLVCWINALYSFECAWAMQGMDLERRLAFIELRWPYFLGFGTPVALASSFWSTFVGLAVFSLCFPSVSARWRFA
ncbi:unnamed protein product [Phaeothamnion confervicola]